jgi:cyclic pyranopterin phosphate synthase
MYDRFNRRINYLRISVTDRCNLRCTYCMPEEGIRLLRHEDILPLETMAEVVRVAVTMGINKVRITGGEPLVRKGILSLVKMISGIEGVEDFGLTTNGISLEDFAFPLAEAGLHRINVSLDTTDPEKYREITRGGDITKVFRGIEAAKKAGFSPIKVNCVVRNSSQEPDARAVKAYAELHGLEARFIHEMDLETGCFTVVEGGEGGDCHKCNRLRLTANGFIKPCLFDDIEFSIHESGIKEAIEKAITFKPEKGSCNLADGFHSIGG